MGKSIVKIYGDGEIWIDGKKSAKIYPDGEIYSDGKRIGRIYEDGDIWIDGKQAGRVFANGDVWIGSQRVATGVYLLELLGSSDPPQPPKTESRTSQPKATGAFVAGKGSSLDFSSGSFGCGAIFVIVLLVVAFIYACFRLWLTELPELLFSNMQIMDNAATMATYICMGILVYLHLAMATQEKKKLFFRALLMQAASFYVNITVFTVIDLMAVASRYNIPVVDALGELGGLLGGDFFGKIFASLVMGLAPAIVSTLVSAICIKLGKRVPLPVSLGGQGFEKNVGSVQSKAKSVLKSVTGRKGFGWKKAAGLAAALVLIYAYSTMPTSLFMGVETSFELKRMLLPAIGTVAGIYFRRRMHSQYKYGFFKEFLIQTATLLAACFINWSMDPESSIAFEIPELMQECLLKSIGMALFMTFVTIPFADD